MSRLKFIYSTLIVFASSFFFFDSESTFASARVPRVFGSGAVLQRDATVPIWGWGDVGEEISVSLGDEVQTTTVGDDGEWRVELPPRPAGGPFDLTISAVDGNEIVLNDVYFGDVWICAGESNMSFPLKKAENGALEVACATRSTTRFLTVPAQSSPTPLDDFDASWKVCSPETAADFSALAYFFGKSLSAKLGDVPLGLVNVSRGGATCEAWCDPRALAEYPELAPLLDPERVAKTPDHRKPGYLRAGMLAPLRRFAIKGVVWSQGESNASRAWQYRLLFPLLISTWREDWAQGDFPFYFVQLANFMRPRETPGESAWAELREVQRKTSTLVRNVGAAVAIDVGEPNAIIPKNKSVVGDRLARLALAGAYGVPDVVCRGPELRSTRVAGDKAILTFSHTDGGLKVGSNAQCDAAELRGFAIAGADQKFHWAKAEIDGNAVVVSSPEVASPVAVRYAWADNPICNLTNGVGLPASPFRTDDWAGVTVENR